MLRKLYLALPVACMAAGCATTYSFKEFSPTPTSAKSALIDIKQRGILSSQRKNGTEDVLVMCAEPSPDALSSISSELAADVKYKELLTTTLSLANQEAASFVGLRTQTIQMLRDGMYRLCEGYMSGAITGADYAWLIRRYQKYMVALLTIEQLTRVAQAPTIAHTSQGAASAARSANAIHAELEEVDKNRSRLDADKKALDSEKAEIDKLADDDAKKAKLADVGARIDANEASTTRANEIREALLEGLKSAKGVLASGSTAIQVTATQEQRAATSANVATMIGNITLKVLDQDDLGTTCLQILDGSKVNVDPTTKSACAQIVKARADSDTARANILTTWLSVINTIAANDPMSAEKLIQAAIKQDNGTAPATPVSSFILPPVEPRVMPLEDTHFYGEKIKTVENEKLRGRLNIK